MSAKFTATLRDTDKGFKAFIKSMRDLTEAPHVKVGLLGDSSNARDDGQLTNVEIGGVHEFGTEDGKIPERSFMRSTLDAQKNKIENTIKRLVQQMLIDPKAMPAERILGLVGAKLAADIKNHVTQGDPIPPPNTPEVFMRKLLKGAKGFNKTGVAPRTLVDTGQMIGAITWAVSKGGE